VLRGGPRLYDCFHRKIFISGPQIFVLHSWSAWRCEKTTFSPARRTSLAGQLAQRLAQRKRGWPSAPSPRPTFGACRQGALEPVRAPEVSVRAPAPTGALRPDVCCALGHRGASESSAAGHLPTSSLPGAGSWPVRAVRILYDLGPSRTVARPLRTTWAGRGVSKIAVLLTFRVAGIPAQHGAG
jgi:hypothetical protein